MRLAGRWSPRSASRCDLQPLTDIEIEFDNDAAAWHTTCTRHGPRPAGHARRARGGDASAGVVVHSARVTTVDGRLVDRFALTDRLGRKLDDRALDARSDRRCTRRSRLTLGAVVAAQERNRAETRADPRGKR